MISRLRSSPPALPLLLRLPLWVLAGIGVVVVVVLGLRYAGTSAATGLDASLMPVLFAPPEPLYQVAVLIDFCGEPVGAVLVVASLVAGTLWLGQARTAVVLVAAAGVSVGVTTTLKPLLGRTIYGDNLSFPSGHTAFAVTVGVTLALAVAGGMRLGAVTGTALVVAVALVVGAAMGWAEVALGSHYPTDTMGGFGVALAVVPLVAHAHDQVLPRSWR